MLTQPLIETIDPYSCVNRQNRLFVAPNAFNAALASEAALWARIVQCGGLAMTTRGQRARRYQRPPWETMPPEGERLNQLGSIALPAIEQVDTLVLDFQMPFAWDGVATNVMMTLAGSGLVEGSGDVVWRLKVGDRWIPDFSNVIFQLNDLRNPHALVGGYIRALSLQRIRIYAALGAGALGRLDPNSRINAGFVGWKYPKR